MVIHYDDSSDKNSSNEEAEDFTTKWKDVEMLELKATEVYMMSTKDGWKIIGSKLKTKMYLADSGANVHVMEDGSLLQSI